MKRFRFLSTDKITGRTFKLCAEGHTEDVAANKLWDLGFLISASEPCPWVRDRTLKPVSRFFDNGDYGEDHTRLRGRVHDVIGADFETMATEINTRCDVEDRHWLLNELVRATEGSEESSDPILCELFCWQWFIERHEIVDCLMNRCPDATRTMMYEVKEVDRLRIIHSGERAAQVCEYATSMKYPLPSHDWLIKKAGDYRKGKR